METTNRKLDRTVLANDIENLAYTRSAGARKSSMTDGEGDGLVKAIFAKNLDGSFKNVDSENVVSVARISRALHLAKKAKYPTPNAAHSSILAGCRFAVRKGLLQPILKAGANATTRFKVLQFPAA
jgi:hypothetical protein